MSGFTSKRDYTAGREKIDRENGRCRVCGSTFQVECAHLVARSQCAPGVGEDPRNTIPLCRTHHRQFDRQDLPYLDILPYLTREEQGYAVSIHPGGLYGALWRLTNDREAA